MLRLKIQLTSCQLYLYQKVPKIGPKILKTTRNITENALYNNAKLKNYAFSKYGGKLCENCSEFLNFLEFSKIFGIFSNFTIPFLHKFYE